jgi:hypothetical protein
LPGGRLTLDARAISLARWIVPPLAILIFGWTSLAVLPHAGLDPSWVASLYMATHAGLAFGSRVVFTFGPLGFLMQPGIWDVTLWQLAFAYTLVLRFSVAVVLFRASKATFGGLLGFVMVLAVVGLLMSGVDEVVLLFGVGVWALQSEVTGRRAAVLTGLAGAYAGAEMLGKLSVGASLALMTAVLVLALPGPRVRRGMSALSCFVSSLLVVWLIIGQPLAGLPRYLSSGSQIVTGFPAAMSFETPAIAWEMPAALLILCFGLWAASRVDDALAPERRAGLAILWAVYWFSAFKEGFVRHDSGHGAFFFGAVLAGFVAFRWQSPRRAVALLLVVAIFVASLVAEATTVQQDIQPGPDITAFISDAADALVSSRAHRIEQDGRNGIERAEPIDAASLELLRGHTVAVYPSEQSQAWAYGLDWDPIPVLQSYSAYTSSLDRLDADFLASSQAPTRILFEGTVGIDHRLGAFDESATLRAIYCRYRDLRITRSYAVLARSGDRCPGVPVSLATVHAAWGQPVAVPPAPRGAWMVYVRIAGTAATGWLGPLVSLAYRPPQRFDRVAGLGTFRLVTGTATDGLIMSISRRFDYRAPLNFAVGARTIAVLTGPGSQPGGTPITYSFFAQRIG